MSNRRLTITRLDAPVEILSIELVKEFIGLDDDLDAAQERVLPVLRQAAMEQGQYITGIVWQAAAYRIDGIMPRWPGAGVFIPLSPAFAVADVIGTDAAGQTVSMPDITYDFIPSAIDMGRFWAELHPRDTWPDTVHTLSVICTAGWTEEALPNSLRGWLLNRIAGLFDTRSDMAGGSPAPKDHTVGLLDKWTVKVRPDD